MIGGERFTSVAAIIHVARYHGAHFNPIAIVTQLALLHDPIATNRLGCCGRRFIKTVFGAAGVAGGLVQAIEVNKITRRDNA